jgi:hypothetical protein
VAYASKIPQESLTLPARTYSFEIGTPALAALRISIVQYNRRVILSEAWLRRSVSSAG